MTREPPIPETMTLHVPFRIVKRGGRKEMLVPAGQTVPRQASATVIKALARAFRWKQLLDSGAFSTVSELAQEEDLDHISRAHPPPDPFGSRHRGGRTRGAARDGVP